MMIMLGLEGECLEYKFVRVTVKLKYPRIPSFP